MHVIDNYTLDMVLPYIDWNPFFQTWELRGRYPNRGYPKIFDDEHVGKEAKDLFNNAKEMLDEIVAQKTMRLKGVVGIFPANRSDDGEDVEVWTDSGRTEVKAKFCMLRQQAEKDNEPYFSQADFVAPKGHADHLGMFAVSCFGAEELAAKYESENDDYKKIMAQALADRLVEAFAEAVHKDMRTKTWGYAAEEDMKAEDLLKVKYDGIRPAPGYPSQPDHSEKSTMWDLIQAKVRCVIYPLHSPAALAVTLILPLYIHRLTTSAHHHLCPPPLPPGACWYRAERHALHDARLVGLRPRVRAPEVAVLRCGPGRQGPGPELRRPQGRELGTGREVAQLYSQLRPRLDCDSLPVPSGLNQSATLNNQRKLGRRRRRQRMTMPTTKASLANQPRPFHPDRNR